MIDKIETNIYDKIEYHFNCAIQILTNSITGEQSIGWVPMDSEIADDWVRDYLNEIN